jgi:hypothetical protein
VDIVTAKATPGPKRGRLRAIRDRSTNGAELSACAAADVLGKWTGPAQQSQEKTEEKSPPASTTPTIIDNAPNYLTRLRPQHHRYRNIIDNAPNIIDNAPNIIDNAPTSS